MTLLHMGGIVCAGVGIALSIFQMILLVWREYDASEHQTLSHVGAKNSQVLGQFRRILIICGTLITIGVLTAIAPYTSEKVGISVLWLGTYLFEILAAVFPAVKAKNGILHTIFSLLMATGFLATAIVFVRILPVRYAFMEYYVCLLMGALAVLAVAHPKKFIFYEMPFIALSHISILIALYALR